MNFSLDIVLYLCGLITSVAAASAVIVKVVKITVTKVTKEVLDKYMEDYDRKVKRQLEELEKKLNEYIKNSNRNDDIMKETLLAQTRLQINDVHTVYLDRSSIDSYTLSTLEDLHKAYKRLGGNHFIDNEMAYLRSLKVTGAKL